MVSVAADGLAALGQSADHRVWPGNTRPWSAYTTVGSPVTGQGHLKMAPLTPHSAPLLLRRNHINTEVWAVRQHANIFTTKETRKYNLVI